MKYKIIQIMPNNNKIKAEYKFTNNNKTEYFYKEIVGFALVEYVDGQREVKPLEIGSDGIVHFIDDLAIDNDDGFISITNNYYK